MSTPARRYEGAPKNLTVLSDRLRNALGSKDPGVERRMRVTLANVIVGQMLPDGAVKGGTAMKVRLGQDASRFTPDLDAARRDDLDPFLAELAGNLAAGWEGFTGRIVPVRGATPRHIPAAYLMVPFDVKLDYRGKSWHTVRVEIGHNEIGDAENPEFVLAEDIIDWFKALGFPEPQPLPVMRLDYQIAQKLHACSEPGSERAHDLVDLQLAVTNASVNLPQTRDTAQRLFRYRGAHAWPPTVTEGPQWSTLYAEAAEGLDVLPTVGEAVAWANRLISDIDSV